MSLLDLAGFLDIPLSIVHYPNQGRFSCSFKCAEVKEHKEHPILSSEYGNGRFPEMAMKDYVSKIRGKLLVFNATSRYLRREYLVPKNLRAA